MSADADGKNPDRAPPRAPKRWLKRLAIGLAAALLALAALFLFAVHTEPGTRALFALAERIVPGELSAQALSGTLADGVRARGLRFRSEGLAIDIDRFSARWRLNRSPLTLDIRELDIGRADVRLLPTPPEPRQRPQTMRLPLAVQLHRAEVRQLNIANENNLTEFKDIRFAASSDRVDHRLLLRNADTPWGRAQAHLQLNGEAPHAIAGTARFDGSYNERPFRADLRLSGTLPELMIQATAAGERFRAEAAVAATPYAELPFRSADLSLREFDPHLWNPDWPRAVLDVSAKLVPAPGATNDALVVSGPVALTNARPGPLNENRLPLESASAQVRLDGERQLLSDLRIGLGGAGALRGEGELRSSPRGELRLYASKLNLHAIHNALAITDLAGPLSVRLDDDTQVIDADLRGADLRLAGRATLDPKQIALEQASIASGDSHLELAATLARDGERAFSATGRLQRFNPATVLAKAPGAGRAGRARPDPRLAADINATLEARGTLGDTPRAQIDFTIGEASKYAGMPLTGAGNIRIQGRQLLPSQAALSIAGNAVALQGSFGQPGERLRFRIDAPALDRLGFGIGGQLQADGTIAGTFERPAIDARYEARQFVFGDYRASILSGQARIAGIPGTAPNASIDIALQGSGIRAPEVAIRDLQAAVRGSYASHTIRLTGAGTLRGEPLDLNLAAEGKLARQPGGYAWDGMLQTLRNQGVPRVALASPVPLSIAPAGVTLGAARLSIAQADIDLQSFRYLNGELRTAGAFRALDVGHVLSLWRQFTGNTVPIVTDLVLDGSWNLTLADNADGSLRIERRSGDVRAIGETPLGLTGLTLAAVLRSERIELEASAQSERVGTVGAQGQIQLVREDGRLTIAPQSALSGRVALDIPRLRRLSDLAGPTVTLTGSAAANLTVAGTLGEPKVSGTIEGKQLGLMLFEPGVRLRDGSARITLDSNVLQLRELVFRGGDGTLRATGRLPLDNALEGLQADIVADNLQLLADPAAQLTVSGRAAAAMVEGQPAVTGNFTVNRARISMPETGAPRLGDDVVILRDGKPISPQKAPGQPAGPLSPRVNVTVNLGNDFRFEGSGADLRLAGTLKLQSEPGESPQAYGTVQVVEGSYEAFGTELAIERGVINFQGPLNNPNVSILAMRRERDVSAGIQVTGTARRPRVELVSDPYLPQEEQLSWLIFGRGGAAAGGTGQAQRAARGAAIGLANMLGGERAAQALGLDAISIGESEYGAAGTQVVSLGKTLSDRLYLGYEQSLSGTESVLKLVYEWTRSWSVVLLGGTVTGVELTYTKRFDRVRIK